MIDERFIDYDKENNPYVKSSILYTYSQLPKVKKMYFGKYRNEMVLNVIKSNMEKKTVTHESGKSSYDVSFEYNPEKNKAWYSEEYRGCGNGHYYIALNPTHALFVEDD